MLNIHQTIQDRAGEKIHKIMPIEKDVRTLDELARLVMDNPPDMNNLGRYEYARELGYCLPFTGLDNVAKEFGKETLIFIYQELGCEDSFENLQVNIGRIYEKNGWIDKNLLRLARSAWSYKPGLHLCKSGEVRQHVRQNYLVLDQVKDLVIPKDYLDESLLKHKRGEKIKVEDYSTEIAFPRVAYGRHPEYGFVQKEAEISYELFVDGLFGVILKFREEPNAIVSFLVDDQYLKISHLQGVNPYLIKGIDIDKTLKEDTPRSSPKGLFNIKTKDVLFEIGKYVQGQLNMKIAIQSGHNNPRTKPDKDDRKIHLPLEEALKIYDTFAADHEFDQDAKSKDWFLRNN